MVGIPCKPKSLPRTFSSSNLLGRLMSWRFYNVRHGFAKNTLFVFSSWSEDL